MSAASGGPADEEHATETAVSTPPNAEEPVTTATPSKRKAAIAIGAAIVMAIIVFGVILPQLVDWNLVGDALRTASGWDIALLVLLALVRYWPAGWIYSLVLPGLSLGRGVRAWVATTGVSSTLPGFDLVLRAAHQIRRVVRAMHHTESATRAAHGVHAHDPRVVEV